ncbi:MAG: tetratricopeptide repeat protein [Paramuribaculum sp.]|nr:tetratricopeptide repeat protein [Paramuribaculum sp.]
MKKSIIFPNRLLLLPGLFILAVMPLIAAKPRVSEARRDALKSDYIFLEALNYQATNRQDAYYSLIDRAYELNPSDPYVGFQKGLKTIFEADTDSAQYVVGLDLMKRYVDGAPDDIYNALAYARIASTIGDNGRALATWEKLYNLNPDRIEVIGMYADVLSQTGISDNIRKAIGIYDDIDHSEGITPQTATRKMRLYNQLGDTAAVKAEMKSLLESSPASSEYATLAGGVYMEMGDRDSALVFFDRAVDLDPSSGTARYQRALYYDAIGDSARYDSELFQALQLPDLDLQPKLGMLYDYVSKLYSDSIQQPRIESMFQSLISQYPHDASVRNLYGDYLITVGRYAPAAEQVSYALDSDPSDPKRWQVLGSLYYSLDQFENALNTAERAIRYHSDIPAIYTLASSALIRLEDYDGALHYLRRGLAEADSADLDQLSELNTAVGDVYYTKGDPDSAMVYYAKALEYNPDNLTALNNCAYHLACLDRDLDKALEMIERVVSANPESATSLDTYAWVLFKRKDYAKAREAIDGAMANDENPDSSAEIYNHAGDIYFMDGHPEQALEFWKRALRLRPDDDLLRRKVKHKTFFYN